MRLCFLSSLPLELQQSAGRVAVVAPQLSRTASTCEVCDAAPSLSVFWAARRSSG